MSSQKAGRFNPGFAKKELLALVIALVFALPLWASVAPTNVRVAGGTATTQIIEYNCPSSPNLIEASEGASISALVHDVDASLGGEFNAWNLDTRPGSLVNARTHTFFFGQHDQMPRAYLAANGNYYSAALQASTLHTFRITCGAGPADAQSFTGSFTTKNIPAGTNFTRPTAFSDPNNPGVQAIPTFDFADRNQRIVDPVTGALIRHMSFANQEQCCGSGNEHPFAFASGANWTNPNNILASDSALATYSAGGNDPICIRSAENPNSFFDVGRLIGGLTMILSGKVDDSSTVPQQDVELALTIDGCVTPFGPWLTATLPKAASYNPPSTDVNVGDSKNNPTPILAAWRNPGQAPPGQTTDMSMRVGTVNTSGTSVDYNASGSGNTFPPYWGSGVPFDINTGSGYVPFTVASVQTGLHLTLTASAGTLTNVPYRAATFGVMIRPKVAAARTVSIDYARMYLNIYSSPQLNGGDGMSTMCSMRPTPEAAVITAASNSSPIQITVSTPQTWTTGTTLIVAGVAGNTAANGTFTIHRVDSTHFTLDGTAGSGAYTKRGIVYLSTARTGYQCAHWSGLPGDWHHFWIATSDGSGDAHYLGPLWVNGSSGGNSWSGSCGGKTIAWDWQTDPVYNTVYCITSDQSTNKSVLLSATYTGSVANGYNGDVGAQPNQGSSDTQASWDITKLTGDLGAQVAAFDNRFDVSVFGNGGVVDGFQDSHVTISGNASSQDTMGWRVVYDPVAKSVSAAMPSMLQLPAAYCSIHTANTNTFNPFIVTTLKNLIFEGGGTYNGPYTSAITSNGGAGVGSVSATLENCSTAVAAIGQSNVLNVTGTHCTTVTVASEPITPGSVTPANSILMPAPIGQPMQFTSADPFSGQALTGERVRLIAKNGLTWVVQRAYYSQAGPPPPPAAQPAGSLLEPLCGALVYQMLPPLNEDCCLVWWDWKNDRHANNLNDPFAQQAGDGSDTSYPMDPDPAKQICLTCTMRKEDTFARLGHFATGSSQSQTVGITLNDNGNNNFFASDSAGYPNAFWQAIAIRSQPWPSHLVQYHSTPIGITAPFSGVFGDCVGNCADIHPSTNYTNDQSLLYSANPVGASPGFPGTVTPQSGQLYKVTNYLPAGAAAIDPKRNSLLIQIGFGTALNVSGPGCSIGTTSSDSFKWGLVYKANECVSGSVPGEVYINAPGVTPGPVGSFIAGLYTAFDKVAPYALARDLVVMTAGSLSDNLVQFRTVGTPDIAGARARKISTLLNGAKSMQRTANWRPLADATWGFAPLVSSSGGQLMLLVKTPPFPPDNSIDHSEYVPIQMSLHPPSRLGVDNAIVEFGYDAAMNCLGRTGESCVAAVNNNPYYYSIADAPIAGVPCTSSCVVTIQVLPHSAFYYRVKYRNAANAVLATSATAALTSP